MKRTRSRNARKTSKSKTRNNRKKVRGGGCGCGSSISGGSAGLGALPYSAFYPLNDEVNNPNYIKGGKKRKIRGGWSSMSMPTIGLPGGLGSSSSAGQSDMINGTKQYFV